jgi:hypothetical protein
MPAEVVRFEPEFQMEVPTQAVFWKQSWTDEWVEVPELWCTEATWAVAPTISTATIRHRYGDVLEYAAAAFAARAPLRNQVRVYVRVDFNVNKTDTSDTSNLVRSWYGVIEIELDGQDGALLEDDGQGNITAVPTGRNFLHRLWPGKHPRPVVHRPLDGWFATLGSAAGAALQSWPGGSRV